MCFSCLKATLFPDGLSYLFNLRLSSCICGRLIVFYFPLISRSAQIKRYDLIRTYHLKSAGNPYKIK